MLQNTPTGCGNHLPPRIGHFEKIRFFEKSPPPPQPPPPPTPKTPTPPTPTVKNFLSLFFGVFKFSILEFLRILGCLHFQTLHFKICGYQFDSKLMFWDCFSIISIPNLCLVLYQYSVGAKLRCFGCPPLPLSPPQRI